ncbi:MAG TPA: hypothetical protein VI111_06055 [Thermoleophilaceae bacterium]
MESRRSNGWFGVLGTGAGKAVAAIVAVGAVAAAIAQVTGLFAGPPELNAEVRDVSVGAMALDEYVRRHDATALAPDGHAHVKFAAYSLAEDDPAAVTPGDSSVDAPATDDENTGDGNTDSPDEGGQTIPQTETDTVPQTETTDESGTTTEPSPDAGAPLRERLHDSVVGALSDPSLSKLSLPERCVANIASTICGGQTLLYMAISPEGEEGPDSDASPAVIQQRLVSIFREARTGAPDQSGKRPLIGVDVNFQVSMTGFKGDTAEVHWSLHQVRGDGSAVPDAWFDRRVLLLKPEADKDTASPEFWVPLPRHRGPFVIRVSIFHGDTRLVERDSPPIG